MVTGNSIIDLANTTSGGIPQELANQLSSFIIFLQAIGGIFVLYLIFNVINTFLNRKKQKEFNRMNENLLEIKNLLKKIDNRLKK